MRIASTRPPRSDETPVFSYVAAERLVDGSIFRIEPATSSRHGDETPSCVCTAQLMAPRQLEERLRFGDWLVRRGLIDRSQLFAALTCARQRDLRIGDALVALALLERGLIEEEAAAFATFSTWVDEGQPLGRPV